MLARFTYWYLRHPMWGRPLALMIMLYWLASVTVALAPPAFASTNAEALNWTGVKDNQGVPLGNYYLASIDIYQAAKDSAADVSWNPSTWIDWLGRMGSTMGGGALASVILTAEAGLFVGMLAVSVWLFRLAAKSVWLTFFATLARPFVDAIFIVTAKAGLLLWLLPIAVFAGGWVAMIKGAGARDRQQQFLVVDLPSYRDAGIFLDSRLWEAVTGRPAPCGGASTPSEFGVPAGW